MGPKERSLIPGTVDLLILRALTTGPLHGFGVSRVLLGRSDGVLEVKDAALYQALHRLEEQRMVTSSWGLSENNRRAKFYAITARGRRHLEREAGVFRTQAGAVLRVLEDDA